MRKRQTSRNFLTMGLLHLSILSSCYLISMPQATACTFCGGGLKTQQTLRERLQTAEFVAYGRLRNPKFDPNSGGGTTEFQIVATVKASPKLAVGKVITLPRYYPIIGDTPPDYFIFATIEKGQVVPFHGLPATAGVSTYLAATGTIDAKDASERLGFYFKHLDSTDPVIARDAFLEFAKTPDSVLVEHKKLLDAPTLRRLILDPKTPSEHVGVFAMLLGLSGNDSDAALFQKWIQMQPTPERIRENLGGFLAGLTLMNAQAGWSATKAILTDANRPFDHRLTAVSTVRFFQSTRAKESKQHILQCYNGVLQAGDMADIAIEDLRRWGWWELTNDVLSLFNKPTHQAPIIRRGIVRYALSCPKPEAQAFVNRLRASDAELVQGVEETLKLYEAKP